MRLSNVHAALERDAIIAIDAHGLNVLSCPQITYTRNKAPVYYTSLPLNENRYSLSRALPRKRKRRVLYNVVFMPLISNITQAPPVPAVQIIT